MLKQYENQVFDVWRSNLDESFLELIFTNIKIYGKNIQLTSI